MEAVGGLVRKAKIHPGVTAGGPRQNLSFSIGSLQVRSMMRMVWRGMLRRPTGGGIAGCATMSCINPLSVAGSDSTAGDHWRMGVEDRKESRYDSRLPGRCDQPVSRKLPSGAGG